MADEGVGLRRSAVMMTCSPALVRRYAVLRWLGVCMPRRVTCRSSQIASPERYGVS